MSQLVVLNLGKGNWQQGFPSIAAQIWAESQTNPIQVMGSLPALPELQRCFQQWRDLYQALYRHLGGSQLGGLRSIFEIDETDVTHVSKSEFKTLCQTLHSLLNQALSDPAFQAIERQLRTQLNPIEEVRLVILADQLEMLRFPWEHWQFFDDYPRAELALNPPNYGRSITKRDPIQSRKVRILAVLGNSQGIEIEHDRTLLSQLPQVDLQFLVEPTAQQLNHQLWEQPWDILFFAGHSSSRSRGILQLNPQEEITIEDLKYSLRRSIEQGLKLAIFNSCDGLGLAQDLATLHIPQMIVMREPVPDRVAQEFLKYFLTTFSAGQSLYLAVREAREKLQAIEAQYPCASWLPVLCQNPAEPSPRWQDWCTLPAAPAPKFPLRSLSIGVTSGILVAGLVIAVRALGWLQTAELATWDGLMRLRPGESPDDRIVVITIGDQDIQAQGNEPRRGSLSDLTTRQLLTQLTQAQPRVIGLDIYRDFSASDPQLAKLLKSDRLVAICKRPDAQDDASGILPPPETPGKQVGFSDFVQDSDGIVRRQLISMSPQSTSRCTASYSFSAQLAFRYLASQGVAIDFTPQQQLKLGQTVLNKLGPRSSGYQPVDAAGIQFLLNYRNVGSPASPRNVARQIALTQLLKGEVNPEIFRDRIVIVGVVTPNTGDIWPTPYGQAFATRLPGVMVQAQMVSQLLSVALDRRPMIHPWPFLAEGLWIVGWSLTAVAVGLGVRSRRYWISAMVSGSGLLIITAYLLLLQGAWVPLLPPMIGLWASSSLTRAIKFKPSNLGVKP
ncbi:CHASE2 domain-containing protein [Alkalinema sp. FACHB-956]|uniref:CHASE2 domain-containing protein n=1 Tax=Alkalinema sp. FACHB-956 TaxID=2692768 RepID=UPI0016861442|nr:CHASE2 domain-containing protein [Alkalinema sp. FACHB-956]MBD2327532.1 CHASE2 domain-containing protein [Alkalinema sp. FACHB-956]